MMALWKQSARKEWGEGRYAMLRSASLQGSIPFGSQSKTLVRADPDSFPSPFRTQAEATSSQEKKHLFWETDNCGRKKPLARGGCANMRKKFLFAWYTFFLGENCYQERHEEHTLVGQERHSFEGDSALDSSGFGLRVLSP